MKTKNTTKRHHYRKRQHVVLLVLVKLIVIDLNPESYYVSYVYYETPCQHHDIQNYD